MFEVSDKKFFDVNKKILQFVNNDGERVDNIISVVDFIHLQESCNRMVSLIHRPEKSFQLTKMQLLFEGDDCYIVTVRDISQISMNIKLLEQNKTLQIMTSSVNHEMLTPLKCMVQLLDSLSN